MEGIISKYNSRRFGNFFKVLSILITSLIWTSAVFALPGDEQWDKTLGLPGFDGEIHNSVMAPNGDLYVVGDFSFIDGMPIAGIAKRVNGTWFSVGDAFDRASAIAIDMEGNIYVSGYFKRNLVENNVWSGVAYWDGSDWTVLSSTNDQSITSVDHLAIDNSGKVYAAGSFMWLSDGNTGANQEVAYFDGDVWVSIETELGAEDERTRITKVLLNSEGHLIMAGQFSAVNGLPNSGGIAIWNGSDWGRVGTGLIPTNNNVLRVADMAQGSSGELYVVGSFLLSDTTTNETSVGAAMWNKNSDWSAMQIPEGYSFYATKLSLNNSGDRYFLGSFYDFTGSKSYDLAIYNGASWTFYEEPTNSYGFKEGEMTAYADGVVVVGYFFGNTEVPINRIAYWNGIDWNGFIENNESNGITGKVYDSLVNADGTLIIAGRLTINGSYTPMAKWIGNQWEPTGPSTYQNSTIAAIELDANGDIYMAGNFTTELQDGTLAHDLIRWDGLKASRVIPCSAWDCKLSDSERITKIAIDKDNRIYVAGHFDQIRFDNGGYISASHVAMYSNGVWSAMGTGLEYLRFIEWNVSPHVDMLYASSNGSIYIGGSFDTAGGHSNLGFAHWDGIKWDSIDLSGTYLREVNSIVEDRTGDIYIASGGHAARWDGESLSIIEGPNAGNYTYISEMALLPNGNIITVGNFGNEVESVSHLGVAIYDGSDWLPPLGSGMDGHVRTISIENNGHVFFGGEFITTAGGSGSTNVARWFNPDTTIAHECNGLTATIVGTSVNDVLTGTASRDVIAGLGGDDQIFGLEGDDVICGGEGDDIIDGGAGTDWIDGEAGNDQIKGGPDNDNLFGGDGEDNIRGSRGNDVINGGAGNDIIDAGVGDDVVKGGPDDDTIYGNDGADNLRGSRGNDTIDGGEGDDQIDGGVGDDFVKGAQGNDVIAGGDGVDTLRGSKGDDALDGGAGNDQIFGGVGNDYAKGGPGNDYLSGGLGDDVLRGSKGDDSLDGGTGNDSLNGGVHDGAGDVCLLDAADLVAPALCEIN